MAAKGSAFKTDILELIFNGTALADLAENDSISPATDLYLGLYTADPTGGNQSTSEISYTGYARVAVDRTSGEWAVSAGAATLVNAQTFPEMTGGAGGSATHIGVGVASSGAGYLLYAGPISPAISCTLGTLPVVTAGSGVSES